MEEKISVNEYVISNYNYLIMKVAQELDSMLSGNRFIDIRFSKLSMESITKAKRKFFKEYPELKPEKMTKIRE